MTDAFWVAFSAVTIAALNTAGSILMLWIRAHYRWRNGNEPK